MKRYLFIILLLSGLLPIIRFNQISVVVTSKIFAVDPPKSEQTLYKCYTEPDSSPMWAQECEFYDCSDGEGAIASNIPCNGICVKPCDLCNATIGCDETCEGPYCEKCKGNHHGNCPQNSSAQGTNGGGIGYVGGSVVPSSSDVIGTGVSISTNTGTGSGTNTGTIEVETDPNEEFIVVLNFCPKCHKNPCRCPPVSDVCPKCHKNPCICSICPVCHKDPCICQPEEPDVKPNKRDYKVKKEVFLQKKDSVFNAVTKQSPNSVACNKGVQEMFKSLFGFLPKELNKLAADIADTLSLGVCPWHKISFEEANDYANKGYFTMFASTRGGHVNTILPGYSGFTVKDIHVMDTGWWVDKDDGQEKTRSRDHSFSEGVGSKTLAKGAFYYFDPTDCPDYLRNSCK